MNVSFLLNQELMNAMKVGMRDLPTGGLTMQNWMRTGFRKNSQLSSALK